MKKNMPIEMKKIKKFSNPAKQEVLQAESDSILTNYIKEISNFPTLNIKEERELAKKASTGDQAAKIKLIQSNLKLVITIAKKATSGAP